MKAITATVVVSNLLDELLCEESAAARDLVRSIQLDDVVWSTNATNVFLPTDVINKLGLALKREVDVWTCRGLVKTHLFEGVVIYFRDRSFTTNVVGLPEGDAPLLGTIAMLAMGIELDLIKQELRLLPMDSTQSYLRA